jgi:hypothetical protein
MLCSEVRALTVHARALMFDLAALHDGRNNGHIALSRRVFHALGWRSHDVMEAALAELLNAGLIVQTVQSHGPKPRRFALAWLPILHAEGLTLPPTEPIPMPDREELKRALKIARGDSRAVPLTWSLATGAFVAGGTGSKKKLDISRRDRLLACGAGNKKFLVAGGTGSKDGFVAGVAGSKDQMLPVRRATKPALLPVGRASKEATVNRPYMGVVGGAQTTDPNLDSAESKKRERT